MSKIYLDTNVLWSGRQIRALCDLARLAGHQVVVPALVHAERIAQMRRERGSAFSEEAVESFLNTHNIRIEPFDRVDAERAANVLAVAFPTEDDWSAAKHSATSGRHPATTDFFIGAPLVDAGHTFVSGDKGVEFRSLKVDRITYQEALARLSEKTS